MTKKPLQSIKNELVHLMKSAMETMDIRPERLSEKAVTRLLEITAEELFEYLKKQF